MKFNKILIPCCMLMLLSSCGAEGGSSISSSKSEDMSSSSVSDEFDIQDLPFLFYGNDPEPLVITNTNREDEIVYEYDDEYLDIDENKVEIIKDIKAPSGQEYSFTQSFTVKATLGSVSKYFTVSAKKSMNRENKVTKYVSEQSSRSITKGEYTLFCGDSFFDYLYTGGWHNFYNDVEGKGFDSGVAASTLEEWFNYSQKLIYRIEPKYISIHLGSNDFWDLKSSPEFVYQKMVYFLERIHRHLPNTKIILFGVENRTYPMPNKSSSQTISDLKQYNNAISAFCANTNYIKFVDSFAHFTDSYGNAISTMFKDGIHPIDSEYEYYTKETIKAGADNISFKESGDTTPSSFSRSADIGVTNNPVYIQKNGKQLTNEFLVSGNISYSFKNSTNAHIEIAFDNTHFQNRFLIWNNVNSDNVLRYAPVMSGNHGVVSSNGMSGLSGVFSFKLLVSKKNNYLFINDELKAIMYYFNNTSSVTISSELINIVVSNFTFNSNDEYSQLLSTLSPYENDSSTIPMGIAL